MAEIISTLRPTGGDFSTVSAWLASLGTVSGSDQPVLEYYQGDYGGADGAMVDAATIANGLIPAEANRLIIRPAAGQEHDGVRGGGFIWQNTVGDCLDVISDYVTIIGVEFRCTGNSAYAVQVQNPVGVRFENCIFEGGPVSGGVIQLSFVNFDLDNLTFIACEAYDCGLRGFSLARGATIYNCGAFTCGDGFNAANQVLVRNTVSHNNTGVDFGGAWDAGSSNNRSSDGTTPGTASGAATINTDFETWPTDLRPATGTKLDGNGADLSGLVVNDIRGVAFTVPYDIGARNNNAIASTMSFDGPDVADVAAVGGTAYNQTTASKFSTNGATITYSEQGTAWPSWLDLDTGTGVISGTPGPGDVAATTGHIVRATDDLGGSADSNAFDVTVTAPAPTEYDPSQPADVTANVGSGASFLPIITSGPALSAVVWQALPPAGSWANIDPPETNAQLDVTATMALNNYRFRRIDVDVYGQFTASREALLTVQNNNVLWEVDPMQIVVNTLDVDINIGSPVTPPQQVDANVTESMTVSDTYTARKTVRATLTDSFTMSDTGLADQQGSAEMTDSMTISDTYTATVTELPPFDPGIVTPAERTVFVKI